MTYSPYILSGGGYLDKILGYPAIEKINLDEQAEIGSYWSYGLDNNGFARLHKEGPYYSTLANKVIKVSKGSIVYLFCSNYTDSYQLVPISIVSSNNTVGMYDTGIRSNASGSAMTFLAPIDCYIALSYYTMKPHEAYIVNTKNLNGACHALEYPLVFHPFYEDIGAKYNKESECWELNGLTDLSEDDMHEIYQGSIGFSYGLPLDGFFYGRTIIRTTPHLRFSPEGVSMKNTFSRCWNLEIIDFTETSMHTLILNSESTAMYETFYGCTELREIKFILDVNNNEESNLFFDTFKACNSLKTVLIRNISQSISFEDSPLISIDSISELIYYKKDSSSEITVTVHPNTYSYLIGTAEPPAEVGGTAANWQKWMANGVKKGITFAVSE